MVTKLFEDIQEHLSMLDLAVNSSEKIRIYAQTENLELLVRETENRERIINIVTQIQRKVEEQINLLHPKDISSDGVHILKCWFHDLNILSEKMLAFDKEAVELLAQQKEETTKEIAMVFKNRQVFKNYNHSEKK